MKRWLLGIVGVALVGCVSGPSSETAQFRATARQFVAQHYAVRPLEAVALGWHDYDGRFEVPTRAALATEVTRLRAAERELAAVEASTLPVADRLDLEVLRGVVAQHLWTREVQRVWAHNPMTWAGALDVSIYLKRDFKPLKERVGDMAAILNQAPALFAAAREVLDPVLPRPFVETAIEVGTGTASFLEQDVLKAAQACGDPAALGRLEAAVKLATTELRGFNEWLRRERLPNADQSFAVGRDGFAAMLRSEGIPESPERILELGMAELQAEEGRFAAAAREIDPTRPPTEVFKAVQREHPTVAGLLPDTRRGLEAIRAFVVERKLVTIPSEVRARVEETLPPFRATSFASMDTPGPFERRATEAYYYVTPAEAHWPVKQQDEWLSAFNYYTTDVVSIHEAYPGHYTQFLALNASGAGIVAKVFPSYSFAEGWAHYTEEMVVGAGFGQPGNPATATTEARLRGAKYRLAQSDEALLRLCRLVCAIRLHCQGMTLDQATDFFVEHCHYEPKPARSEALRGTFDPGYLYYTVGKLQIRKLRKDREAEEGAAFSARRFHDELLSHGAPPLAHLRRVLLKDPAASPGSL